jgi:SAM-dependent methyltransferase
MIGTLAPRRARLAYRRWYWRGVGGVPTSTTDDERAELARLAAGRDVLEVGSQYGATTIALASTARRVFAVDHHLGDPVSGQWDTLEDFIAELNRHGLRERVVPLVGRMEDVLPRLSAGSFEFVFVDSGKETEDEIREQAAMASRVVAPGGTIAFHDYGRFDVIDAALDAVFGAPTRLVGTLAVFDRSEALVLATSTPAVAAPYAVAV